MAIKTITSAYVSDEEARRRFRRWFASDRQEAAQAYWRHGGPGHGRAVRRRAEELGLLCDLLARAATGEPQVALIGGEAGVGKTRLAEQLAATASQQGCRVLRGGCVPLGEEGVPLAQVIQALHGLAGELDVAELEWATSSAC